MSCGDVVLPDPSVADYRATSPYEGRRSEQE